MRYRVLGEDKKSIVDETMSFYRLKCLDMYCVCPIIAYLSRHVMLSAVKVGLKKAEKVNPKYDISL